MHLLGHLTIGLIGYGITKEPLFLLGSILPDAALIPNELRFVQFNKWDVRAKFLYDFTHSLFFPLLGFLNPFLGLGILIHILVDIPFHTSSFRWRPFLFNRYKSGKKALLISGGPDSIACGVLERDYDLVYFDYGQDYHEKEYPHAEAFAKIQGKKLIVIKKKWSTDIPNRNFYFISELKKLGYDEVIIGTRAILPIFDKHGDSNWLSLKIFQYLFNIYVNTPIILNLKYQVYKKIGNYGFYSTEKSSKNILR